MTLLVGTRWATGPSRGCRRLVSSTDTTMLPAQAPLRKRKRSEHGGGDAAEAIGRSSADSPGAAGSGANPDQGVDAGRAMSPLKAKPIVVTASASSVDARGKKVAAASSCSLGMGVGSGATPRGVPGPLGVAVIYEVLS